MSTDELTRKLAKENGLIKYYALLRPVSLGAQPSDFISFINYDNRTETKFGMAWAELYYNRKLSKEEMYEYELVEGEVL